MNRAILEKALRHFGHDRQRIKCVEELAELMVELLHATGPLTDPQRDRIAYEIADVLITVAQMEIIIGTDRVHQAIQFKVNRLQERMESE